MTFPHFYNADPSLAKAIDGVVSLKSEHDWYFDIEPHVGSSVGVQGSGQVSMISDVSKTILSNIERTQTSDFEHRTDTNMFIILESNFERTSNERRTFQPI